LQIHSFSRKWGPKRGTSRVRVSKSNIMGWIPR